MSAVALDHPSEADEVGPATHAAVLPPGLGLDSAPASDEDRPAPRRREPARDKAATQATEGAAGALDGRQLFFVFVGTAIATASFTISGGTTGAMTPVFMPLTTPISPWLRAMISASQTVQNTLFTLTASADLILRTDAG